MGVAHGERVTAIWAVLYCKKMCGFDAECMWQMCVFPDI